MLQIRLSHIGYVQLYNAVSARLPLVNVYKKNRVREQQDKAHCTAKSCSANSTFNAQMAEGFHHPAGFKLTVAHVWANFNYT